MKVGITGASGFIGRRVVEACRQGGLEPVRFSRRASRGDRVLPPGEDPDLTDLDAIVNLAGHSVFGMWTKARKRRIVESRVQLTRRIVAAIAKMRERPRVLVNASAIGFYGETGERLVDEGSPGGEGFLAETCRAWEAEAERAGSLGVRVVFVRIGFVLGKGGALQIVRPLFRMGLGGRLGSGRQWMSPVHVDDVAGIMLWAIGAEKASGPYNATLPEPVRNEEFTYALARAVHRPAILPAPEFALRLAFGEMSQLMLDSLRVAPRRTLEAGYKFRHYTLPAALEAAVAR